MATGASGSFSYLASGGGNADYYLEISWTQEYTPGNNYSDVKISANIRRSGGNATGGTWFAWSDGGISVNGTRVISWYEKSTSHGWTYSGANESLGSGSVQVYHTNSTTILLESTAINWNNTSVSSASFFFPAKSESLSLNSITQPHTLTISPATGTSVSVNRTSSPSGQATGIINSGATIYDGDVLQITGSANTGYNFGGLIVNGSSFSSGSSITVSSDVSVSTSAAVKQFVLSISAGTGTTITVNRTSSPKQGASTGNLSNGAIIYYDDVLKISGVANTGYDFGGLTVNNTTFTSGNTTTVTSAVSVASTATLKSFTLSISAGVGSSITVNRTSSINTTATIGNLNNGDTIYYGDILKISMSVDRGYYLGILTVNGSEFTNGGNYTVREDVSVVSNATEISMEQVMPYVYDGTNYNLYVPYVYENGEWVQCVVSIYNQ